MSGTSMLSLPWMSRPSGFCYRWWWYQRTAVWSRSLSKWAALRVAPYSQYQTFDDVPMVRLGCAALLEASAEGLDGWGYAARRSSRFGVWEALDSWSGESRGALNLSMLTVLPVRFGNEICALMWERREHTRVWALLALYSVFVVFTSMWVISVPPHWGVIAGMLAVVGVLGARFAVVSWVARRLARRVERASSRARKCGPSVYEDLVFQLWGPLGSWSVRNVEHLVRSSASILEFERDPAARWVIDQFDDYVRQAPLDGLSRETFAVLMNDGFDGSLDDLVEVARRL